jgi:hypothetical protein
MILTLYVDDILLTGDWLEGIDDFKVALKTKFSIKDLGRLEHCLGFNVHYDDVTGSVLLNQHSYIDQLLSRFECTDIVGADTPAVSDYRAYDNHAGHPSLFPYRALVGSLLYLERVSRPDISNVVRLLSKHSNDFTSQHVHLAKRVLRYLQHTKNVGITYVRFDNPTDLLLCGYSDSSYADNVETARSTTGFVHLFGGAAVVWKSVCQRTVARSSCEAEYMAMSAATDELIYIRRLLLAIAPEVITDSSILYGDNKSAILIGKSVAPTSLSRHISVRYHNVKQFLTSGDIILHYVASKSNLADLLTKNLFSKQFFALRDVILGTVHDS